eukprot:jgi/Botrbrau1/14556/Bobra.0170s0012.1
MATAPGPAPVTISAALLPVLKDLPPPPAPVSGYFFLGHAAGFQLVNCTPVPLNVSTFDQHDGARAIPNKKYTVAPKTAVNCMANGNNAPFDIQFTINNGSVARAPQSIRLFAVQDPRTDAVTLTVTPPKAEVPAPVVVTAGGPTRSPALAPKPTPTPKPVNGNASGPAISAALLPVLKDLPPVPPAVSGNYVFGHEAGFQLVNCTPVPLDVSTFDQHDGARAIPNKKYTVAPKTAVNCMANGNEAPFDIQYTINNNPVARAPQSTRLFAIQDTRTGAISVTQTAPEAEGAAAGLVGTVVNLPFKLAGSALKLPKKLVFGIAKSVVGESTFNLLMGLAGQGLAGFHLVNATDGPLNVLTYNQADTVYLAAFKAYNLGPGQEATCEATPLAGAAAQGVFCRLNGAKPLFVSDGTSMKAVKDPASGIINLVEEAPVETTLRILGKAVGADRVKYVADLFNTAAGLAEKGAGGLLGVQRVKYVKDLYSKVWDLAAKGMEGVLS